MTNPFKNTHLRLRTKFSILLVTIAVTPLLVVTVIIVDRLQETQRQAAITLAQQIGRNVATQVRDFTSLQFAHLNDIGRIYATVNIGDAAETEKESKLLERFLYGNAYFSDLALVNAAGQEIVRENTRFVFPANDLVSRSSTEEFEAIQSRGYYLGELKLESGRPRFTIGTAIHALDGTFVGGIFAEVDARVMETVVKSTLPDGSPGRIYIIDKNREIIADPDLSRVLAGRRAEYLPDSIFMEVAKENSSVSHEYVNESNRATIGVTTPVTINISSISAAELPTNWTVVAEQDAQFVLAPVVEVTQFLFIVMILAFFVVAGIGIVSIRPVVRPLEKLHAVAQEFGKGNLESRVAIQSSDEIGDLAQGFNHMAEQLSASIFALERDREQISLIVENTTDGLIEHTADNHILLINPIAGKLLGIDVASILKTNIGDQVRGDSHGNLKKLFALPFEPSPRISGLDTTTIVNEGREPLVASLQIKVPYERYLVIYSVWYEGKNEQGAMEKRFLKIIRDVTHEQLTSRMKSEFIAIVAHQLRTPLTQIKWMLDTILGGDLGELVPRLKELLKRGEATNKHMIELVGNLLNVSRIEEGHFGNSFQKVDVGSLLNEVVQRLIDVARARSITLNLTMPERPLPMLFVDAQGIELALTNLVSNAVNYTKEGGIVTITALLDVAQDSLEIVVADTGIGIPDEEREYIFNRFFRASNAIRFQPDGSGIGLFIAKSIVERHGGELSFQSAKDKGSTFTLSLPLKEMRENPQPPIEK